MTSFEQLLTDHESKLQEIRNRPLVLESGRYRIASYPDGKIQYFEQRNVKAVQAQDQITIDLICISDFPRWYIYTKEHGYILLKDGFWLPDKHLEAFPPHYVNEWVEISKEEYSRTGNFSANSPIPTAIQTAESDAVTNNNHKISPIQLSYLQGGVNDGTRHHRNSVETRNSFNEPRRHYTWNPL